MKQAFDPDATPQQKAAAMRQAKDQLGLPSLHRDKAGLAGHCTFTHLRMFGKACS